MDLGGTWQRSTHWTWVGHMGKLVRNMVGNVDFREDEKGPGMQAKQSGFYLIRNGEIPGLEKTSEMI